MGGFVAIAVFVSVSFLLSVAELLQGYRKQKKTVLNNEYAY